MQVIGAGIIENFGNGHPDALGSLSAWLAEVKMGDWENPIELKQRYPSASLLGKGRTVFNIKGNSYRLDTQINYEYQVQLKTVQFQGG